MKQYIYADNAATTKLDIDAFEAMKPFLLEQYGNASQPYSFARSAKKALKEAREIIASCIGALPEEVYFTSGGSESDNWVVKGNALLRDKSCETIMSEIEHHAMLHAGAAIAKLGYSVKYLPVNNEGLVQVDTLKSMLSDNTKVVSVMLSNNEIGTIEPIKELAEVVHQHGALFHTDAVQAVGHIKIDVKELNVDFLSSSGHKFNGPKGIGFLYIKKGIPMIPFNDGGSQEFGLRAGTENIASIVGMAVALKKACDEMEDISSRLINFENILLSELQGVDFIRNGSKNHVPGNISLSFRGADGEALLHRLDLKGICVSTGSACDSVDTQISHVLKAIKLDEEYAKGTIRISLGKYNTEEEVYAIASALKSILI